MGGKRVLTACVALLGFSSTVVLSSTSGARADSPPVPGSPAYIERDVANMDAAFGRNFGELESPGYTSSLLIDSANTYASQLATQVGNPTRPALTGGNLVPGWNAGNPLRSGWAGTRGQEVHVSFTNDHGALLQGDVFAPLSAARDPYTGDTLTPPYPGVVVITGSIQASRGLYTWVAEDLAERGYVVLTFDVQGQGQSETLPHQGSPYPDLPFCDFTQQPADQATPCPGTPSEQQANFDQSAEDAITFFLSTPGSEYPNPDAGSANVNTYNPLWALVDHTTDTHTVTAGRTTRLAVIGHSTGAVTVSYLQGVDPRIEAAVALDKITATRNAISDDQALLGQLPGAVEPKVPTLGLQAEYGFEPQPYFEASCSSFEPCPAAPGGSVAVPNLAQAPDPNREEATGFDAWESAAVDSMVIVPRASTHLDFTDAPFVLPASVDGQAMASYYIQAWLDKYLRHDDAGADTALLSSDITYNEPVGKGLWQMQSFPRDDHLSFYFCSGYSFRDLSGATHHDQDITGDGCRDGGATVDRS